MCALVILDKNSGERNFDCLWEGNFWERNHVLDDIDYRWGLNIASLKRVLL